MNRLAAPLLQQAGALAWSQRNQQWLSQRLAHWRDRLAQRNSERLLPDELPPAEEHEGFEPAALRLAAVLNLTPFETELLVLAAGIEIDNALRQAVAAAQGVPASQPVQLAYSLALALLPQAHWDALSPLRPLRHWALVHVDVGAGLAQARLRIDERVLHHLTGVAACDERLAGIVEIGDAGEGEQHALQALAVRIAAAMEGVPEPLVMLGGAAGDHDGAARPRSARALAAAICRRAGLGCLWVDPAALAQDPREIVETARRIDLEAALSGAGVALRLGPDGGRAAPRCG
jgi:hypothetical protein